MQRTTLAVLGILTIVIAPLGRSALAGDEPTRWPRLPGDDRRLAAVVTFADNVLATGRDTWSRKDTPLLADGVNVDTRRPVEWVHRDRRWIVSNLASQQNLFRTLSTLTRLTGQRKYRATAEAATRYHLDHLRRSDGLLSWGGHRFIDLRTLAVVGEQEQHELKCSYPYYELLWEIDPNAAGRMTRAIWNAHVLDWGRLDMNRHGVYGRPMGELWESRFTQAKPFFAGDGLTFINCGSDLVYVAGLLASETGDGEALTWAKRLAEQYVLARDPNTHLGAYQFSQPRKRKEPPNDRSTSSYFGDRAQRQFGPEFGAVALEGKMLAPGQAMAIYGRVAISQLRLAERLGDRGADLLEWNRTGMVAFVRHAYDANTNLLKPMFTDGTPLTPADVKRPGYYRASSFQPSPANGMLLLSYALAHRLTGDEQLWRVVRSIAKAHGLGDLGAAPGQVIELNAKKTTCDDPLALLAVLEIMRGSKEKAYVALARRIGDNIVASRFHKGFFLPSANHINARFDTIEPLALLTLEAHLRGTPAAAVAYPGGRGYIHGPHDGLGRTYDSNVIWNKTRGQAAGPYITLPEHGLPLTISAIFFGGEGPERLVPLVAARAFWKVQEAGWPKKD